MCMYSVVVHVHVQVHGISIKSFEIEILVDSRKDTEITERSAEITERSSNI